MILAKYCKNQLMCSHCMCFILVMVCLLGIVGGGVNVDLLEPSASDNLMDVVLSAGLISDSAETFSFYRLKYI